MADLITLQDVKTFATITSTTQDVIINDLIPKASEFVKNYCGRTFVDYVTNAKVQVFSGGVDSFFLVEEPIINILDFDYSQDFGQTYNSLVEYTDYVYNLEDNSLQVCYLETFPKGTNAYRVTYNGGYTSVPADLKQATIDLVLYYMKSDMSVKSTRSPGSSATQVEYIVNSTVPSHIRRVLDYYRLQL